MRLGLAGAGVAACLAIAMPAGAQAPQRIDGIAAVVNDQVYNEAFVRAVRDLRLVDASARVSDAAATRAVVERRLILDEIARFAVAEPPAAAVTERRQQWAATLPAGFDQASALERHGLTQDDLLAWFKEDVRIEAYLNRLFMASAQPTTAEIADYVRLHAAALATDGSPAALEAAAKAQLARDNRQTRIRDWIDGLKRRADITIKIK
jgi:hypothetical protein